MTKDAWLVTVFKCDSTKAKEILIDFYDFMKETEQVRDLHFFYLSDSMNLARAYSTAWLLLKKGVFGGLF